MATDKNLPKKIAVLMGGPGSERDVSLATGRGVAKALRSLGAEVVDVDVRYDDVANFRINVLISVYADVEGLSQVGQEDGVRNCDELAAAGEPIFAATVKGDGIIIRANEYIIHGHILRAKNVVPIAPLLGAE